MLGKISAAAFLITASVVSFGCDFGPPTPPTVPLKQSQVSAVLNCQHTIKQQGQNFATVKLTNVEACLDEVLAAQVPFENGLTTSAEYQNALTSARRDCLTKFQLIGLVSTTMINDIVASCGPVENIILPSSGYDPLEFEALSNFADSANPPLDNVTDLAGAVCGAKEEAVDWMVFLEVPRMGNLLDILNNDTTGGPFSYVSDETPYNFEFPNIPLDERCNPDLIAAP